jgi:hypothetical protein
MADELDDLLSEADAASAELDAILGDGGAEAAAPPGPAPDSPAFEAAKADALAKDPNVKSVFMLGPDGESLVEVPIGPGYFLRPGEATRTEKVKSNEDAWRRTLAFLSGGSMGLQAPMMGLASAAKGEGYEKGARDARLATESALRQSHWALPVAGGVLPFAAAGALGAARSAAGGAAAGWRARLGVSTAQGALTDLAMSKPGERLSSTAEGAAKGLVGGAIGEGAGAALGGISSAAKGLPQSLRSLATSQSVRTLRPPQAMLGSLQQQTIAGKPGDVAVGEALLREGIVQPGSTLDDIAAALRPKLEQRGQEVGDWLTKHGQMVGSTPSGRPIPSIPAEHVAQRIEAEVVRPRTGAPGVPGAASTVSQGAARFGQEQADLIREMVRRRSLPKVLTLEEMSRHVKQPHGAAAAAYAKSPMTAPESKEAAAQVYTAIRRMEDEAAERSLARIMDPGYTGAPGMTQPEVAAQRGLAEELAKEGGYSGAKERFRALAAAANIAERQRPGMLTRRGLSLSDYLSGLGAGDVYLPPDSLSGVLSQEAGTSALQLARAVAHKLVRERGNATVANLAWRAAPNAALVGAPMSFAAGATGEAARYGIPAAQRAQSMSDDDSRAVEEFLRAP